MYIVTFKGWSTSSALLQSFSAYMYISLHLRGGTLKICFEVTELDIETTIPDS